MTKSQKLQEVQQMIVAEIVDMACETSQNVKRDIAILRRVVQGLAPSAYLDMTGVKLTVRTIGNEALRNRVTSYIESV